MDESEEDNIKIFIGPFIITNKQLGDGTSGSVRLGIHEGTKETVAIKEINELIKVMKNAQKIIRRDPDLMTVMQININDSDITSTSKKEKKVIFKKARHKRKKIKKPKKVL